MDKCFEKLKNDSLKFYSIFYEKYITNDEEYITITK